MTRHIIGTIFSLISAILTLAGCAATAPLEQETLRDPGPNEGMVIGSLWIKGGRDGLGRTRYDLAINRADKTVFIAPDYTVEARRGGEEVVFAAAMPVGDYRISQLRQLGFSNFARPTNIGFRVQAGRATYIGRLLIEFPDETITVFTPIRVTIEDVRYATTDMAQSKYGRDFSEASVGLMAMTPSGGPALPGRTTVAVAAGKVVDGVYSSPFHNYAVPVPVWRNLRIQDHSDGELAIVTFLDRGDFPAPLQSILCLRLPPNAEPLLETREKRDALYQNFLTGFVMPNVFQNVAPQTTIVHQEFVEEGDARFHFAVVNIPQGHTALHDPRRGTQEDSVSGLLIFHNRDFIYMLRVEMKTLSNAGLSPSSLSPADLESARKSLLRTMSTMTFTN